jgi:hypothetical protein
LFGLDRVVPYDPDRDSNMTSLAMVSFRFRGNSGSRRVPSARAVAFTWALSLGALEASGQGAAAPWLRLDPLPGEMRLTARESFDGVPPRFVLMTDGSVYVGGRREVLKGALSRPEMQDISTRLDQVLKSLGKSGPPPTLAVGEGPAIFRLSVLLGTPFQTVIMGDLKTAMVAPSLEPLPDFVRRLANFRHPSLRPFDPPQFAMVVREKVVSGGCRSSKGLPALVPALSTETVVSETVTRGFPTGPDVAQVCDGLRRYTVVFRPLIPGER